VLSYVVCQVIAPLSGTAVIMGLVIISLVKIGPWVSRLVLGFKALAKARKQDVPAVLHALNCPPCPSRCCRLK
jgi:hypothetical protein